MRLGQLARKIDKTPTEIANFLKTQGADVEVDVNAKLSELQVDLITQWSKPEEIKKEEKPAETPVEIMPPEQEKPEPVNINELNSTEDTTENKDNTTEEAIIDNKEQDEDQVLQETHTDESKPKDTEESAQEENEAPSAIDVSSDNVILKEKPVLEKAFYEDCFILKDDLDRQLKEFPSFKISTKNLDVIRAPKVALPGIKVVGKIEIPEDPVKKRRAEKQKEKEEKERLKEIKKKEKEEKELKKLYEERKREKNKEKRKRKQEKKKEKRKKRQHYLEQVAKESKERQKKQKEKKKKKELVRSEEIKKEEQKPKPKTLVGKFFYWLTH